jgi:NADP-reducing hydrogenase subunit HndD
MEAALRTVSEVLDKKETQIEFKQVRGTEHIKEATFQIAGQDINVAVVHGGVAIQEFLDALKDSPKQYHFVEFMGCTGGCINGGGQPIVKAKDQDRLDIRKLRAQVLYDIDEKATLRKSHQNEFVKKLYEDFLEKPHSKKAHDLLHTTYHKREAYQNVK